jgi:GNAT superfamily N-acetyltransferase
MPKNTMKKNYATRLVEKSDLDLLFAMLNDLVNHEGLAERFKMTRERLEEELFGIHADWYCLIATDLQDNPIGFCLYTLANINRAFNTSPMIQVDDLYVKPEWRKSGIGQNLLLHLARIAKNRKIGRINAWCVCDNIQGQNFYRKIAAEKRDFVDIYSMQVGNLLKTLA